jgi:NAD(P)-dependent dehydrogenase (short-subunit alcohol dehydrogenase family)
MGKLDGKIALITGGSSGIGLATAKRFVAEGAYVFVTGRSEAELNAAVKDIGKNIKALKGDVSSLGNLDRILSVIKQDKGTLDIVFANAVVAKYAALGEITEELYDFHFNEELYDFHFNIDVKGM